MTSEASWLRHITTRLYMHVNAHFYLVVSSLLDGSHQFERSSHEATTVRRRLRRKSVREMRRGQKMNGAGGRRDPSYTVWQLSTSAR